MSRQPSQTAEAPPGDDELFRSIFAQSATGIAVVAAETGRFLRVNAAACAIFGTSEQELLLKSLREITDPDDIEASDDFLLRLASGETPIPPRDLRCLRSDGSKVWVRLDVTVIRDAAGVPVCYACLMQDGTANVRAHEALQASEERFRSMLQMSSDWYWAQDAQFRFIELPGFEKRDFSPEAAMGMTRWELSDAGLLPDRVWQQHRAKLERHEPFSDFVFMRYNNAGELRYLSVTGEPVFDRNGNFEGYRGVGKDVTEEVRVQKAIEGSEARYRLLFDIHPHPMWVVDSRTLAFLAVNESAVSLYGYSKEQFLTMTADQIRPPEDVPRLLKVFEDQSRAYQRRFWRHKKKNGELIDVEITSFNLEFDGRPARLGVVTDITERLKAEERAREIEERYQALLEQRH